MNTSLIQTFKQIAPISDYETERICAAFKPIEIVKGDFFLKAGEVNKYVGFLQKGLVRYFVLKNDEESTFEITKEGEFIADYQSFMQRKPSIQNIQAIEDCELLVIDFEQVIDIYKNTEHGNLLGGVIVEHRFEVMVNQLLAIYMQNQEERYLSFIDNYSDLAQRIPQFMIASYVGIKPQSLNRMRRRFAKKSKLT